MSKINELIYNINIFQKLYKKKAIEDFILGTYKKMKNLNYLETHPI